MKFAWIGYIATALSALALLMPVYSTIVTKSVHSITYKFLTLGISGQVAWLIYGYINRDWSIVILAMYLILCFLIIASTKAYYEVNEKDLLSETKKKCMVK